MRRYQRLFTVRDLAQQIQPLRKQCSVQINEEVSLVVCVRLESSAEERRKHASSARQRGQTRRHESPADVDFDDFLAKLVKVLEFFLLKLPLGLFQLQRIPLHLNGLALVINVFLQFLLCFLKGSEHIESLPFQRLHKIRNTFCHFRGVFLKLVKKLLGRARLGIVVGHVAEPQSKSLVNL